MKNLVLKFNFYLSDKFHNHILKYFSKSFSVNGHTVLLLIHVWCAITALG